MDTNKIENGFVEISLGSDLPNLVALKLNGQIGADEMAAFVRSIQKINDEGSKAIVYIDLVSYDGFESGVIREKLAGMNTLWNGISKIAYVLDSEWMSKAIHLIDVITPIDVRSFSHKDEEEAKTWVLSKE